MKPINKFIFLSPIISLTFLWISLALHIYNNETKNTPVYVVFGVVTLVYPVFIYISIQQYKNSIAHKAGCSSVDPIAEANVYLAYGRKEQAATILKEALASDPENEKILEKLKSIEKNLK